MSRLNPCAEEDVLSMRTVLYENRVRQYFPPDQIFNYFATYLVEEKVTVGGKKTLCELLWMFLAFRSICGL